MEVSCQLVGKQLKYDTVAVFALFIHYFTNKEITIVKFRSEHVLAYDQVTVRYD